MFVKHTDRVITQKHQLIALNGQRPRGNLKNHNNHSSLEKYAMKCVGTFVNQSKAMNDNYSFTS